MKILLIGSGGREHAFAWKMNQSPVCSEIFIAPGNAGTSTLGTNINLDPNDFDSIGDFCQANGIGMVVVGPEEPLVRGIVDFFKANPILRQISVIGPSAEGARLEGSKAYAKQFMKEWHIPTAAYREFGVEDLRAGLDYIARQNPPIVLKADGLAAGKGVLICRTVEEAQSEFKAMLGGKFGAASSKVVIEEFLDGIEFSVFVLTDGKEYKILPVAKDYKRIGEGDTGLNTGGMGAVSPPPFISNALMQKVEQKIIRPTIAGIKSKKIDYKGFVFIGLIRVGDEPFVIEYNCRMGDPETEVVFPRLKTDLVTLMQATATGRLSEIQVEEDSRTAATVMLVSGGYPGSYEKGKKMSGWDTVEGSMLFHAGTRFEEGAILTNGGRVLAITSFGKDYKEAVATSVKNAEKIEFEEKYFRKDIGFDLG